MRERNWLNKFPPQELQDFITSNTGPKYWLLWRWMVVNDAETPHSAAGRCLTRGCTRSPPTWVTTVNAVGANSQVLRVSKYPGGNISREHSGEAYYDMRACTVLLKGEKKQTKGHARFCTLLLCWPPSSSRLNSSLPGGDSESQSPTKSTEKFICAVDSAVKTTAK